MMQFPMMITPFSFNDTVFEFVPCSSFVDGRHNYPDASPNWIFLACLPRKEGFFACSQAVMTGQAIRSRGTACRD